MKPTGILLECLPVSQEIYTIDGMQYICAQALNYVIASHGVFCFVSSQSLSVVPSRVFDSTNGNLSLVTFDDMIVVKIIILTAYLNPDSIQFQPAIPGALLAMASKSNEKP